MTLPPLYPVGLRLAGVPCLVVGGGTVAGRKVAGLLDAKAAVTLVAPDPSRATALLGPSGPPRPPASLTVERRPYRPGEAASFRLVVAATGRRAVDEQVWRDAEAAGVFVNTVDDPARCSAVLPAVHREGPVTLAVATGGASPSLAAWLRDRLAEATPPGIGRLAELLGEARAALHAQGRSTEGLDWRGLLAGPLSQLVAEGRVAEARRLLAEALALPPYEARQGRLGRRTKVARCTGPGLGQGHQASVPTDPSLAVSAATRPAAGPTAWLSPT